MRALNRARLLWAYLTGKTVTSGLPVEYIVETTAKCNLYCPMCPRETHKQPKEDMEDDIFERLVQESGSTGEHMMLIGLGEPLLDPKIFDRIEYCDQHGVATLLSTNGVLLEGANADKLLASKLEHITFSFDGSKPESFEYYRKGAKFDRVRDNFVNFAKRKHETGAKIQIVVQMIRLEKNWDEVDDFIQFWSAVPGVDQVRVKNDETNVLQPEGGHLAEDWKYPCHYLWRGPVYIKHNGDVYPCCQSYMLDGAPIGRIGEKPLEEIYDSPEMQRLRRLHVEGRAGEIDMCAKCFTTIPHPLLVTGSLLFHGKWVRKLLPVVERFVNLSKGGFARKLLTPPSKKAKPAELVQITTTEGDK